MWVSFCFLVLFWFLSSPQHILLGLLVFRLLEVAGNLALLNNRVSLLRARTHRASAYEKECRSYATKQGPTLKAAGWLKQIKADLDRGKTSKSCKIMARLFRRAYDGASAAYLKTVEDDGDSSASDTNVPAHLEFHEENGTDASLEWSEWVLDGQAFFLSAADQNISLSYPAVLSCGGAVLAFINITIILYVLYHKL